MSAASTVATVPDTTQVETLILVVGKPEFPGQYLITIAASNMTFLLVLLILRRLEMHTEIRLCIFITVIFATMKLMQKSDPQRIIARSGAVGEVFVYGTFKERVIAHNAKARITAVRMINHNSLAIDLLNSTQALTLDTSNFAPARLEAINQLLNAMLSADQVALDTAATRFEMKQRKHKGKLWFHFIEKPSAGWMRFAALALSLLVTFIVLRV